MSAAGEQLNSDDGYRVEERAKTEEYHQTKNVVEADDRTTEIHVRDEKVVRLEEIMSRETVRLASADEVRALVEAEFDGLKELDAGTEVTVEEFTRTETTRAKTVAGGRPVVESSFVTEELKSDAVKEDPEWKKKSSPMSYSDSETTSNNDVSFSFTTSPASLLLSEEEDVVLRGGVPSVEVPCVVAIAPGAARHSTETDNDASMPELEEDVSPAASSSSSPHPSNNRAAKTTGNPGIFAKGKTKSKRSSASEADVELNDDGNEDNQSRRHETRHKRHVIEEVIIEDSDKFYENQEIRPRLFVKGPLGRKTPTRSTHEKATLDQNRGGGSKTLPGGSSLPNIATESAEAEAGYPERSISGSVHLDGEGKKPKWWYSFPRKHASTKAVVVDDASKSATEKQKAKSQEEIVVFGGQEVGESDSQNGEQWGMKFEKWPKKKTTTREMTFVVDSYYPASSSGEYVKGASLPPRIGTEKTAEVEKTAAKVERVTYVVERELPKVETTERVEDDRPSLSLKRNLRGLFPVKNQNETTSADQPETETAPKPEEEEAEEPVEERRSGSWSLLGKARQAEHANFQTQTVTFIVEQDTRPGAREKRHRGQDDAPPPAAAAAAAAAGEDDDLATEEETKKRSWNRKWPAGEKGETKKETRRTTRQEEVVVDDVTMRIDDTSLKLKLPSFGHRSKGDREADRSVARSEESLTIVVKEEAPVVAVAAPVVAVAAPVVAVTTRAPSEEPKRPSFAVEAETDVDRSGSWNPFGKSFWDKNADESSSLEFETVTFEVEHDLPKADIQWDGERHSVAEAKQKPKTEVLTIAVEHEQPTKQAEVEEPAKDQSFSLFGTLRGIFPQKSTYVVNEPSDELETMTYVVEREIDVPPEPRLDKRKERSWGKVGGAASTPEKTSSSKTSLNPESATFAVERQVTAAIAGKEPKAAVEKEGTLKSRWRQDEIVVDDSHLLSHETEVKIKPVKIAGKKKEPKAESSSSPETPVTNESLEKVHASVPEIEVKTTGEVKQETRTFIVNHDLPPPPENKTVDTPAKEEEKPLKLPHIKLPSLFHTHQYDVEKAESHRVETVTYVVNEDFVETEDKLAKSVETKEMSQDDGKTNVKSKSPKTVKGKDRSQKEIVVDDTQLYSEKSEISSWSPFRTKAGKTVSLDPQQQQQRGEGKTGVGGGRTASSGIDSQVTVTYVATTEVAAAPDLDTSADDSGKKKWRIFSGKDHSKSSPKPSPSKGASLSRTRPQEELVTTGMKHVVESQGFPSFQPEDIDPDRPGKEFQIRIEPPKTEPTVNGLSVDVPLENSPTPEAGLKGEPIGGLKLETENLKTTVQTVENRRKTLIVKEEDRSEEELLMRKTVNGQSQIGLEQHQTRIVTSSTMDSSSSTGAHGHAAAAANGDAYDGSSTGGTTGGSLLYAGGSMPSSSAGAGAGAGAEASIHFVVVAIDFGTTFSGYAFSFSRDVDSVHVMRKWPDGDPGMVNQKTPTVLLLTPDQRFHSFGFTAKDFYHNLTPREAKQWLYFEKFKMALHYNADLSASTQLVASNGHSVPALTVFSHALRFFRDHALREVSDQSATRILNEDVRWVITVPAIWKAQAKQFMRQAAYQAGIASEDNPDQLLVALEPEAASVYIRKQRLQQLIPESVIAERPVSEVSSEPVLRDRISQVYNKRDTNRWSQAFYSDSNLMSFQRTSSPLYTEAKIGEDLDIIGTKYMVADCGGGTVDITVYEMSSDTGNLIELYKATGGPYGSMGVDLEFESLLVEIFGTDFIDVFKAKRPGGWIDLMMAFESRKRASIPVNSKPLNVSLPFSFIDYHKKYRHCTVESAVAKYGNKDVRWSTQGMLRLMPDAMTRLFQPTLNNIKEAIDHVLSKPEVKGVKYIFLVGGFAESPMVQVEMRQEFSDRVKILIPTEASLAILKGAVCFGNDPAVVKVRKSRMSYGLAVLNRFVRGKHPESKLALRDEEEWCLDVFDPLVLANQSVALGSCVTRSYAPAGADQKFGNIDIYCSGSDRVEFVTDPGVVNCGKLRIDLPDLDPSEAAAGRRREVKARLVFGDTEIKVVGIDVATGNMVNASIDFLNK